MIVSRDTMSAVVKRNTRLARNLGETIAMRRSGAAHAIAAATLGDLERTPRPRLCPTPVAGRRPTFNAVNPGTPVAGLF
jgi:hypothetical protein